MKSIIIALLLITLPPIAVLAQTTKATLGPHTLGETVQQFAAAEGNRGLLKKAQECQDGKKNRTCEEILTGVFSVKYDAKEIKKSDRSAIISEGKVYFASNRLARLQFSVYLFGNNAFTIVTGWIAEKYGQPTATGTYAAQNGFGASTTLGQARWNLSSGDVMEVEEYILGGINGPRSVFLVLDDGTLKSPTRKNPF